MVIPRSLTIDQEMEKTVIPGKQHKNSGEA